MAISLVKNSGYVDLTRKMYKGDDGGYYIPNVDELGNLTWTPSEDDMATIEGVNIKGDKGDRGDSGVYIGTDEPTGDVTVWVNPDGGETVGLATIEYVDEAVKNASGGNVDLSDYYTREEVDDLLSNLEMADLPASEGSEF